MISARQAWEVCREGMMVNVGDEIRTAAGESLEISFGKEKKNIVRINEDSNVIFRKISASVNSMELMKGELLSRLKKLPRDSTFEIKTPAGLCGARGTGLGTLTDGSRMTARAYENNIFMRGVDPSGNPLGKELIVEEGWKSSVDRFEEPSRLEQLSESEMGEWRAWEQNLETRLESSERASDHETGLDQAEGIGSNIDSTADSKRESLDDARDVERIEERQDQSGSGSDSGDGAGYGT